MTGSDPGKPSMYAPNHASRRWKVPLTIRLMVAALLAAAVALGASYALRTLNL